MREIRRSQLGDLEVVVSWLSDGAECELWAGSRVSFPVDPDRLPEALEWERADSWSVTRDGEVCAFGQLVPKPCKRIHLARLIAAPKDRGAGLGRELATYLLDTALARQPDRVSLNVSPENAPAFSLYHSLGFRVVERPSDEPQSRSSYMEHAA